jgi:hypothetical protein
MGDFPAAVIPFVGSKGLFIQQKGSPRSLPSIMRGPQITLSRQICRALRPMSGAVLNPPYRMA